MDFEIATLVLLPGMDGTGLLFADFIAALGGEFETIVVRYPRDRALDYAALEQIARGHLPTNRPFILLGESFSGPIAISIAASAPAGLVGLVLCCSFARNPVPSLAKLKSFVGLLPIKWTPVDLLSRFVLGRLAVAPEVWTEFRSC